MNKEDIYMISFLFDNVFTMFTFYKRIEVHFVTFKKQNLNTGEVVRFTKR